MQDDLKTINLLIGHCDGSLTKAATALGITPYLLHNWKLRGVAAHRRLHFFTVFNAIMPKSVRLDLETWLAVRPAHYGNGSKADGRKSRRKKAASKAKKPKGPARQPRKRIDARARA